MSDLDFMIILGKLSKQTSNSMVILKNVKFDILLLSKGELDRINTEKIRKLTLKLLRFERRLQKLTILKRAIKITYFIVNKHDNKLKKYTTEYLQQNSVLVNHIFSRAPKGVAEYKVLKLLRKRGIVPEHLCSQQPSMDALPAFYKDLCRPIAEREIVNRMKEIGVIGSLNSVTIDVEKSDRKAIDNSPTNGEKDGDENVEDEAKELGEEESIYVFDM